MKPIYLYNVGVNLWEQPELKVDERYATVTVMQRSIDDLFTIWIEVAGALLDMFPGLIKWRSLGYLFNESKMLELKILKQVRRDLSDGDILSMSNSTGIYSYAKKIVGPVSEFDLGSIAQSRYSILFFLDGQISIAKVWEACRRLDEGVNAGALCKVISELGQIVVCRIVESDTYAVAQFIGVGENINKVLGVVSELNISRVYEGEIVDFING